MLLTKATVPVAFYMHNKIFVAWQLASVSFGIIS
jgi:hypothetical protein